MPSGTDSIPPHHVETTTDVRPDGPATAKPRPIGNRSPRQITYRLPRPSRLGLVTFGLSQAVLLFWWLAYHPALFTPDSINYIAQSTTGNWNTHHPIAYTALVWLSLQLTGGVAALTLAHTIALAAGLAYAVTGLRRLGGPGWLWPPVAVAIVALPPVGSFVMCLWKDVPFVICHVFLVGTLARLVAHRRRGADGPAFPRVLLVAVFAELALICLFRQNGFIVAAITVVLCVLLLRGTTLRMIAVGGSAIAVALLTNWMLLPALGVSKSESIVAYEAFFSDIAVAYGTDPAAFPAADTAVMAKVAPLTHWRESGDCLVVDSTVYHPDFDRLAANEHKSELLTVWWDLTRRSPGTVVDARICRGAIAWRPDSTGWVVHNPISGWGIQSYLDRDPLIQQSPFRDAVVSRPVSHRAYNLAVALNRRTTEPEWLFWRGATWSYLAYAAVGLAAWRRRDRRLLALASVIVGNQISVLIVNGTQASRYMAAPFVVGILLAPLLVARPGTEPAARTGGQPDQTGTGDQPDQARASIEQDQARLDERG
ncbi:hypothetical protein [Micromonospora polyrhachis]|uniref:Dolichyl-phosphate-mannose-protein mannosyltransferase n=1 Tax=Micromonospora polyrhachis TaxID=1282883 RepID=A0A7W7SNF8_9ACTN|nr:hypothetical protein [Micromonospora polyrhachis]MBB4957656.1 hypothetical protein [Micromonospora polyrhachis]